MRHPQLSVRRQCELLERTRSSFYYDPVQADPEDTRRREQIDRRHTESPFYGSRKLAVELSTPEAPVNRVYPYLLKNVAIARPIHVWSADITYVPMASGFLYLAATIDGYSRYGVAWRLSNTLDGSFCQEMLEEALG